MRSGKFLKNVYKCVGPRFRVRHFVATRIYAARCGPGIAIEVISRAPGQKLLSIFFAVSPLLIAARHRAKHFARIPAHAGLLTACGPGGYSTTNLSSGPPQSIVMTRARKSSPSLRITSWTVPGLTMIVSPIPR